MKSTGLVLSSRDYIGSAEPPATVLEDESRFGNDGAFLSDGNPDWVLNEAGLWVMRFGGDDRISFGNPASLKIDQIITIEAWVKTSSETLQTVVDKYGTAAGGGAYYFYITSNGNLGFLSYDGTSLISEFTTGFDVIDGAWHHIAIVVNNTAETADFYADAVVEAETFTAGNAWGNAHSLYIGYRNKGGSEDYLTGDLVMVRIYNYALSAEGIAAHYQAERHWFGV